MKESEILLNPNKLVRYLNKPASEFTRDDIIKYIEENGIEMINFRYVAEDGKLKALNFVIISKEYLEAIFSTGERVDGSSLFSFIESGSSDLYIIPRFKTAFLNPFSEVPTLDILCSFYTSDGNPLESSPEYILKKAHAEFKKSTGYTLKVFGELEYYVISKKDDLFPALDQKGYHSAHPFTKWDCLRKDALKLIAETGGKVKYGHSEVGNFSSEQEAYEQHEIEFMPVEVEDAADQIIIAKWILRMLAYDYGVNISFAPKITVGKAGSGFHIHLLVEKDNENLIADENGLTDIAKKVIAGILDLASPLLAFGNTIPTSFLRLVPQQEAPTRICWGDGNRSVLVRIPLGWVAKTSMIKDANPKETRKISYIPGKQTIEFRAPDGSADVYGLLAGITIAAQHGLEMKDALMKAEDLYVDVNIFKKEKRAGANCRSSLESLECLPSSCWESADCLNEKRKYFEKNNIFPKGTINNIIEKLRSYDDKELSEHLYGKDDEIRKIVNEHLHCM
ncbi:MAG: glutamine synthetase family protein [Bacteroidota bacterium]